MSDRSAMIELWTECNNLCSFCFLGDDNRFETNENKLKILHNANVILDKVIEKEQGDPLKAVGLIGGEFFQGQLSTKEIYDNFYSFCKRIFNLMNDGLVTDFWCYATLTIGDQKDLYTLIDLFDKTVNDKEKHTFWILVSYDTKGRYHTEERKQNFLYHLENLQKYPFIKFNTTSIMTEDFCQKVLSGELNLKEYTKKYKSTLFLKNGVLPNGTEDLDEFKRKMPWFLVKRKTFIKFLRKLKIEMPDFFNSTLQISLRADDMYNGIKFFNSEKDIQAKHRNKVTWDEPAEEYLPCGHTAMYQCYDDSDACCLCDYLNIKNGDTLTN